MANYDGVLRKFSLSVATCDLYCLRWRYILKVKLSERRLAIIYKGLESTKVVKMVEIVMKIATGDVLRRLVVVSRVNGFLVSTLRKLKVCLVIAYIDCRRSMLMAIENNIFRHSVMTES